MIHIFSGRRFSWPHWEGSRDAFVLSPKVFDGRPKKPFIGSDVVQDSHAVRRYNLFKRVPMSREYIERRNEAWYVAGTRVSLESVVFQFREGASPETILQRFPALGSLANIYGAIAFSLDNAQLVEEYLAQQQKRWESIARTSDPTPPGLSREIEPTHPAR